MTNLNKLMYNFQGDELVVRLVDACDEEQTRITFVDELVFAPF